ncbi:hypothetical protein ACFQI3_04640 [Hansschlegelia quercus]|uniref:Uncharacterized protein n=1 Tax=Hansschlegelia quercus TaxID=2528245 RepID=A0A4V2JEG7_9HYPH|nr:hypothetical protein [Hansschlegelia quercus]TBN55166.1 hypothetical protein EYR15_03235 [Hansschlegelia quercus]
MPPFLIFAAAAAGAMFGVKALKREWKRVNSALEESEREGEARDRLTRPTLKRDRTSGEWRPG